MDTICMCIEWLCIVYVVKSATAVRDKHVENIVIYNE